MIKVLKESKPTPPHVAEAVARAGGYNVFGEPNFRVVWGWDRLTLVGGKFEEWELDSRNRPVAIKRVTYEYRRTPKYDPFDRWHVEKWMPPRFYGNPKTWPERTREVVDGREFLELGPFPSRGEYEHVFTLKKPDGGFLDLTPSTLEMVVRVIERSRYLVKRDRARAMQSLKEREQRKRREWDSFADAVLDNEAPAFAMQPFVTVPGLRPNV